MEYIGHFFKYFNIARIQTLPEMLLPSWFPITRLMEKQEHGSRMIVKL